VKTKSRIIIYIVAIFIFLLIITSTTFASTLKVDGSEGYTKIQQALNNATVGDTVLVYPGTYIENIYIDKELVLTAESENPADTIIQAARAEEHILDIKANGVTIKGFTIKDARGPEKAGIYLDSVEKCNISNNVLSNNQNGIGLASSTGNVLIDNNIVSSRWIGIYLERSNDNLLDNNSMVLNNWDGITLEASNNNELKNNGINSNNKNGVSLISSNNNRINNNTIDSNNAIGIFMDMSVNNTLNDNSLSNNSKAINKEGYIENHIYDNYIVDREVPETSFINSTLTAFIIGIAFIFVRTSQKL